MNQFAKTSGSAEFLFWGAKWLRRQDLPIFKGIRLAVYLET